MKKKRWIAGALIITGIAIMAVPFYWHFAGEKNTNEMLKEFEQMLEETDNEKEEEFETAIDKTNAKPIKEGEIIGIIEIESIGIKYPIIAGMSNDALNSGIGYLMETAQIGSVGNCVLAGHNGSRYGGFFANLNKVAIDEIVTVTDSNGFIYQYQVTEFYIVESNDSSIKNQGENTELTLFTCAYKGTKRLVYKCFLVECFEAESGGSDEM